MRLLNDLQLELIWDFPIMSHVRDPTGEMISYLPSSTMCPGVKRKHNETER